MSDSAENAGKPRRGEEALLVGSIMFVDLVSSTAAIQALDPETVRDLLDAAVARMKSSIHRFGGIVARVQGDGVMAIFGAPNPAEDHALRACCAGFDLTRDFAKDRGGLQIRVGVHSGRFITRVRSNDFGVDLDAIGPEVHVAAKIEQRCRPNSVLISKVTLELVRDAVTVSPEPPLRLNADREESVFTVGAVSFDRAVDEFFDNRRLTPFVGRDEFVETLLGEYNLFRETRGRTLSIVGEAGMGKSRLLYELAPKFREMGYRIAEIRGASFQKLSPFAPLRRFLSRLLSLPVEGASAEKVNEKAREIGVDEWHAPALLEMAGFRAADAAWRALEADERKRRMQRAIADLVSRLASRQPILIIVEDVHHLDPETIRCLQTLRRRSEEGGFRILSSARAEGVEAASQFSDAAIELNPLDESAAAALSAALDRGVDGSNPRGRRIVTLAGGNPFFLQELARHPDASASLSINSIAQSRLASLSPEAIRMFKFACVQGEQSDISVLGEALSLSVEAQRAALDELIAANMVISIGENRIRLYHELYRDGVNGTILRAEAGEIHARFVVALENSAPGDFASLERLAHHCDNSGQYGKALQYIRKAILHALQTSAMSTVLAMFAWARKISEKTSDADIGALADITILSLDAMHQLGEMRLYEEALASAVELSAACGDPKREATARGHKALYDGIHSRHHDAYREASIAVELAKKCDSDSLMSLAQFGLAASLQSQGRLAEAIEIHLGRANSFGRPEKGLSAAKTIERVRVHAFASESLAKSGRFAEAKEQGEAGFSILSLNDHAYSRVLLLAFYSNYFEWRAEFVEMARLLREALDICTDRKYFTMMANVSGRLGLALSCLGEEKEALAIVRQCEAAGHHRRGGVPGEILFRSGKAATLRACGEVDDARKSANAALDLSQKYELPIHIAESAFILGRIELAHEDRRFRDAGVERLQHCVAAARSAGLTPLARFAADALARQNHRREICADYKKISEELTTIVDGSHLEVAARPSER